MKKSKIIVPALAILTLSTAASITGTVAWFTASNTQTATAGSFQIESTSGGLDLKVAAGAGTSVSGKTVSMAGSYKLADASFDHANQVITAPDRTGTLIGKKTNLSAVHSVGESSDTIAVTGITRKTNILSAMTFKLTFEMEFGESDPSYALYLDAASNFSGSASDAEHQSIKGFRMAFIGQEANAEKRVWADKQTSAKCSYIDGSNSAVVGNTLASKVTSYSGYTLLSSDTLSTYTVPTAAVDGDTMANNARYLGKFAFAANTKVKLTYVVVVWFEGSDENIVNGLTDNIPTANLSFTAQQVAPAA